MLLLAISQSDSFDWIDLITTVTAIAALITAVWSILLTRRIGLNSIKPLVSTIGHINKDYCGLRIKNYGNGPAVITKVTFRRSGRNEQLINYSEAFDIDEKYWKTYFTFSRKKYYLSSDEDLFMGKIEQTILGEEYDEIKTQFTEEMKKISVTVEYEDVFGNRMPTYTRNDWED